MDHAEAVAAAIFYGLACVKHVANKGKNRLEMFATVSDLWVAVVFAVFIVGTAMVSADLWARSVRAMKRAMCSI